MRSSVISTPKSKRFQGDGDPVISVDTKKKELVGNYKAAGREWEPAGSPRPVKVHDFADKALGKVAPYGVYDIAANTGWVNVGTDADTGAVRGGVDPPLVDHDGRRQPIPDRTSC